MKTITKTVYEFDELSDKAKERARDWFREGMDGENEWDCVRDDAKEIGLKIVSLDDRRNNEGSFIGSAEETLQKVLDEHGADCETHKTDARYLPTLTALKSETDREGFDSLSDCEGYEDFAHEFLYDLLEDYRVMLNKEYEYQNSDEQVDESIRANEYTFLENGKREG